jgi:SAM-dependent methyltransferase
MAHLQQQQYIQSVKERFPKYFIDSHVLDIGSLDVNGNNRIYFTNCNYLGIDIASGNNVDIVSTGHEYKSEKLYDTIISTECFEHDKFYPLTLKNCINLLKPGGMFVFTCATTGRPEHGTQRTSPQSSPLTVQIEDWKDYYKNLTEKDIREVLEIDLIFCSYEFVIGHETCDLYFYGIKK